MPCYPTEGVDQPEVKPEINRLKRSLAGDELHGLRKMRFPIEQSLTPRSISTIIKNKRKDVIGMMIIWIFLYLICGNAGFNPSDERSEVVSFYKRE